jgi:hypothetical protein
MSQFIERLIFTRLEKQFEALKADPRIYERFLLDCGLDAEEALIGRQRWEERPASVVHGYSRGGAPFPVVALVLGQESTVQDYLGEDGEPLGEDGEEYLDDEGNRVDAHVRRWEHRYDLYVYAEHPDEALYLYQLVKQIMVSGRKEFLDADLDEITYSGAELAPDPRYMPSEMFTRRFSITLRADVQYNDSLEAPPFATMRGIAVADDEPTEAAGLTPTQQEELSAAVSKVVPYITTEEEDA